MKKKYAYLLYNNKNQDELYAMAYSVEEMKKESQYYSDGVWFKCDYVNDKFLENEKLYTGKISFPKTPQKREPYLESKEEYNWIK